MIRLFSNITFPFVRKRRDASRTLALLLVSAVAAALGGCEEDTSGSDCPALPVYAAADEVDRGVWTPASGNFQYSTFSGTIQLLDDGSAKASTYYPGSRFYASTDAGANWTGTSSGGVSPSLVSPLFFDAVGYGKVFDSRDETTTLYKTGDARRTWAAVRRFEGYFSATFFASAATGWIATRDGSLYRTSDGGHSWTLLVNPQARYIVNLHFVDERHGLAESRTPRYERLLHYTDDGGKSWNNLIPQLTVEDNSFVLTGEKTGWLAGRGDSRLFKTTDAGKTWVGRDIGSNISLARVWFLDPRVGFVEAFDGRVFKSTDEGETWREITRAFPDNGNRYDFRYVFLDSLNGWASGPGGVSRTIDGGATWTLVTSLPITIQDASSTLTGWGGLRGGFARTTDGGRTWFIVSGAPIQSDLHFQDRDHGWAVGEGGMILETADGGSSWSVLSSPTTADLNTLDFANGTAGWAGGDSGVVLRTRDAGTTWQPLDAGTAGATIRALHFGDENTGWLVGEKGLIRATTDGGVTWRAQLALGTADLNAVHFVDNQHGFIAGNEGTLLRTSDGGATWAAALPAGTLFDLTGISFADDRSGVAVGWGYTERLPDTAADTATSYARADGRLVRAGFAVPDFTRNIFRALRGADLADERLAGLFHSPPCPSAPEHGRPYRIILGTTDGGLEWTIERLEAGNKKWYGVSCAASGRCAALGSDGIAYRP